MKKTGFGFLRLPRLAAEEDMSVDFTVLNAMVDRFLELGGRYFDTAYTYLGGVSEEAIRRALVLRHPRHSFLLADKLPGYLAKSHDACWGYLQTSLDRCGVDYFDVYMLHWLNEENYEIAQRYEEFRFLQEVKAAGKTVKTGFSYHDGPELLDRILTEHPEVDYVQLQINYLDWDSPSIQARKCYDVALKHGKKVIVMEPVKGGNLANLPAAAAELLAQAAPEESPASWAIRFAGSLDQVEVVLSGMNTVAQMEDNMRQMPVLSDQERELLNRAAEIIRSDTAIACTGCGYCVPNCPIGMPIPQYFALYNDYARNPGEDWKMQFAYKALAEGRQKPDACIVCRKCENSCPQKLPITDYLTKISKAFS